MPADDRNDNNTPNKVAEKSVTNAGKTTKKAAKKVAKKTTKKVSKKVAKKQNKTTTKSTTVNKASHTQKNRIAVVAGLRTPFQKIATGYAGIPSRALGSSVVAELLQRTELDSSLVEQLVYGQVIASVEAPNIAREVVLGAGLPAACDAYSVSRACATSYQSVVNVLQNINSGQISVGIAGGADSASSSPLSVNKKMANALLQASKARTLLDKVKAFKGISVRDMIPQAPALKEPSSDYTMGQAAEKMAKENQIEREAQDEIAHQSHVKAAHAWEQGWFDSQVMDVIQAPDYQAVSEDNCVRQESVLQKYASLAPVFDKQYGSVTAANSSPLTDGASAVLLMSEEKAKALGYKPLGYITSYAFAGIDPNWQMLMGPSFATPLALDNAGLSLADIDLIDMHEAFAAQVLSNTRAFESKQFAQEHLNRSNAIGEINWDKFNISGSSIALGHPFAATGTRQLTQMLHDLKRTGGQYGLITACAAGGLGAAMIVEAA